MHSNGYRGLLQGRKFSAGAGGVDQKRHSKSPLGLSGSTRLKNGACCGVAGSDRDPNASRLRDRKKNTIITTQGQPCRSGSFKGGLGLSLSYAASASLPGWREDIGRLWSGPESSGENPPPSGSSSTPGRSIGEDASPSVTPNSD